jgi:hypothetical protein
LVFIVFYPEGYFFQLTSPYSLLIPAAILVTSHIVSAGGLTLKRTEKMGQLIDKVGQGFRIAFLILIVQHLVVVFAVK